MTSTATLIGYDSVASSAAEWKQVVPVAAPRVIGYYGNGLYANGTSAGEAFAKALRYAYDVHATNPEFDDVDVESGDAVPRLVPGWARAWLKIGAAKHVMAKPTSYESASVVSTVITEMLDAGFSREEFFIHSAHYAGFEHICGPGHCQYPQADLTQFAEKGPQGQNVDTNLIFAYVFGKTRKPPHDPHYGWFDTQKRMIYGRRTEQQVVREYDKWRKTQSATNHPHRARLLVLRAQLLAGSVRLTKMSEQGKFHRQWRERELRDRANGKRLV